MIEDGVDSGELLTLHSGDFGCSVEGMASISGVGYRSSAPPSPAVD